MLLDEASVTGTANIVMAAVYEDNLYTMLLMNLGQFWQMMNAMVRNLELDLILTIEGDELQDVNNRILPDMIEIGSWIGLAAMTKVKLPLKMFLGITWE
jgi:UDP-N-acetylglucosamine 1-carboxyvinyltransferase